MRERLHALLMLALYRAGRQADALAVYQRARQVLIDELGVEPAADLRGLHQQILAADPAVAAPAVQAGRGPAPADRAVVPRHLPLAVPHFVGRSVELHVLDGLVEKTRGPGAAVVISTISGTAGAGKTALAVHWAHRVASRFPDGQLYANLHGYGPSATPRSPSEIIRGFLDALGVPAERIPTTLEGQAGPGVTLEHLTSGAQALGWMQAELDVLLAMIAQAADQGFGAYAWLIPWCLGSFLDFTARWQTWADVQRTALDAAVAAGDRASQGHCRYQLGRALLRLHMSNEARDHIVLSLQAFEQEDDPGNQARAHVSMAMAYEQQGQYAAALGHDEQALTLFHRAGHHPGKAMALNALGYSNANLGNYQQALDYCHRALAIWRELGNQAGQGATLDSLAFAYRQLGRHEEAIACYRDAVAVLHDCGDQYHVADTLTGLGDTHHVAGDPSSARLAWQQALAMFDELRHPKAEQLRARLDGLPSDIMQLPAGTPG